MKRFYDSVDHGVLRRLLKRRFREQRLLRLFDTLLDSYVASPGKGLPIGALTSQYLGNFYLDAFDQWIKETGCYPRYLRYMDDIVVFGTRNDIQRLRPLSIEGLTRLELVLKHGGEWNQVAQGVQLLGFVLYPDRLRLNQVGRKRLRRRYRYCRRDLRDGRLDELDFQRNTTALFAHAALADDVAWRRSLLDTVERGAREPSRAARRRLEQSGEELPLGLSQQEPSDESEQEQWVPGGLVPGHDVDEQQLSTTDGARSSSSSISASTQDETTGKPLNRPDIEEPGDPVFEKGRERAPRPSTHGTADND